MQNIDSNTAPSTDSLPSGGNITFTSISMLPSGRHDTQIHEYSRHLYQRLPDTFRNVMITLAQYHFTDIFMWSLLFWEFDQLFGAMIHGVYALNLLVVEMTEKVLYVCLMLLPIFLLLVPEKYFIDGRLMLSFSIILPILRLIMSCLTVSTGKPVVAGFGVAVFISLIITFIYRLSRLRNKDIALNGVMASRSLAVAVILAIISRSIGSSQDVFSAASFQFSSLAAVVIIVLLQIFFALASFSSKLLIDADIQHKNFEETEEHSQVVKVTPVVDEENLERKEDAEEEIATQPPVEQPPATKSTLSFRSIDSDHQGRPLDIIDENGCQCTVHLSRFKVYILGFSIMQLALLLHVVHFSPVCMSRWVNVRSPYGSWDAAIIILMVICSLIYILLSYIIPEQSLLWFRARKGVKRWFFVIPSVLFFLFLWLSTYLQQPVAFHTFVQNDTNPAQQFSLFLTVFLSPVIYIDCTLLIQAMASVYPLPSKNTFVGAFSFGAFGALIMSFCLIFTYVYDYAPASILWQDSYSVILLFIAILTILPLYFIEYPKSVWQLYARPQHRAVAFKCLVTFVGCVLLVISLAVGLNVPTHSTDFNESVAPSPTLNVGAYNIQQGMTISGDDDYFAMYNTIKKHNLHILGLSESDTCRTETGRGDVVQFLAKRLNMPYVYAGTQTGAATFGISLASKYPLKGQRTFFLKSKGEQIAALNVIVTVAGIDYDIWVTHPCCEVEDINFQLSEILPMMTGKSRLMLLGDFNMQPYSLPYNETTAFLTDSWLEKYPSGETPDGDDGLTCQSDGRIDFIFHSPDLTLGECNVVRDNGADTASDHYPLVANIII